MDKKQEIHNEILAFLDNYLTKTPHEVLKKEFEEISRIEFTGTSAEDYFRNFHKYYSTLEETVLVRAIKTMNNTMFSKNIGSYIPINSKNNKYKSIYQRNIKQEKLNIVTYNLFPSFKLKNHHKTVKNYNYV